MEKKKELDYVIEGKLKSVEKLDFARVKLAVVALIKGKEVARAVVDKSGNYKVEFTYKTEQFFTELRLIPDKFTSYNCQQLVLSKTISHKRYKLKKMSPDRMYAYYEMKVSRSYFEHCIAITKTYEIFGTVYSTVFDVNGVPQSVEELPGAKLDFYEIGLSRFGSSQTERILGTCYSGPDGSYEFSFDFTYGGLYALLRRNTLFWEHDTKPDIQVRISQFYEGFWQQVYESPVHWDIEEIMHRDFFIPKEDLFSPTVAEAPPDQGFRFMTIGLIPVDNTRIIHGYATTQPYDPISGISHQPFCDTLRIFGLFATNPQIVSYKVEYACANNNGPIVCINENAVNWKPITDPLNNLKWNDVDRKWDSVLLGPDSTTGRYQNIDTDPEWDWCEHALKLTWRTKNLFNGYYALRITGYDQADDPIGPFYLYDDSNAVMRIDNTLPEVSFDVLTEANVCGQLDLPGDRIIKFRVTAYDHEGHMLKYDITATRGKTAQSAGNPVEKTRLNENDGWTGEKDHQEDFKVSSRDWSLIFCDSMAYNFEFHVYGLATNGYSVTPSSQRATKEMNLIIAES